MQKQEAIKHKILKLAENENRIRAVLLNGSRANPNITPDKYQDHDITFIVQDFDAFCNNKDWFDVLGRPFLQQFPDEMTLGRDENEDKVSYTFLTIFEDGSRIDITLFPIEKMDAHFKRDSMTIIWMDKDDIFPKDIAPSNSDYHIARPTQREFSEVCNEFWWTITNVAKGLKRREILFAKDMMENVVRPMFLQLIAWKVGYEYDFKISIGKSGKLAQKFLDSALYNELLKTYADAEIENNWNSLFLMAKIFNEEQIKLAERLHFNVNMEEANNSTSYVQSIYND